MAPVCMQNKYLYTYNHAYKGENKCGITSFIVFHTDVCLSGLLCKLLFYHLIEVSFPFMNKAFVEY